MIHKLLLLPSTNLQCLRDESAAFLLDEAFLDIEPHFQDLISRKWISSSVPGRNIDSNDVELLCKMEFFSLVDTICATLEDYFQVHFSLWIVYKNL